MHVLCKQSPLKKDKSLYVWHYLPRSTFQELLAHCATSPARTCLAGATSGAHHGWTQKGFIICAIGKPWRLEHPGLKIIIAHWVLEASRLLCFDNPRPTVLLLPWNDPGLEISKSSLDQDLVQYIFPAVLTCLKSREDPRLVETCWWHSLYMHAHEEWLLKTNPSQRPCSVRAWPRGQGSSPGQGLPLQAAKPFSCLSGCSMPWGPPCLNAHAPPRLLQSHQLHCLQPCWSQGLHACKEPSRAAFQNHAHTSNKLWCVIFINFFCVFSMSGNWAELTLKTFSWWQPKCGSLSPFPDFLARIKHLWHFNISVEARRKWSAYSSWLEAANRQAERE